MALKRSFYEDERIGMTQQEIDVGQKYLRKHKTAGAISQNESVKLYELYMIGTTFAEIHQQFPQYDLGAIILTAALQKWGLDREEMQSTLRERVRAKVIKSIIEQTDFLTSLLSVANSEHIENMRNYILDPNNTSKPSLRIESIKEYKEVTETLAKIVQGANPTAAKGSKHSAMFDALEPPEGKKIDHTLYQKVEKDHGKEDDIDISSLLNNDEEDKEQ